MKEYIERMKAISVIKRYEIEHCPEYMRDWATKLKRAILDDLTGAMMEAPAADVVEVVRCKDCKYIRPEVDAHTHEAVGCWCSLLCLGSVEDEHFCSCGERRDDHGTERS